MKMPNLLTEVNTITNVEQFKAYLSEVEMTDNFKSYLESLLNHLNNSTYTNKDEVINAITQALVKDEQVELSNKEALEKMQQYNDDLKRINIISTSLHDNDSKKDIEYITFTNKNGVTEVLATRNAKALSEMLASGTLDVVGKSAEEIFHYFKEYKYIEVDFMSQDEMNRSHPEANDRAVKQDDYLKRAEMQEVEKYRDTYYLPYEVEVAVDQEGERLYRLGDGIIKFKDKYDGSREMVFLQKPSIMQEHNLNDQPEAVTATSNEEEQVEQEVETVETTVDEQMETVDRIKRNEMTELTLEQFKDLIYKKNYENHELTVEEEAKINNYVSMLVAEMEVRYSTEPFDNELEEIFEEYMNTLLEKYDSIEQGFLPSAALSQDEKHLVELYQTKKEILRQKGLKKPTGPVLELKPDKHNGTNGIVAMVIILELAMVGMYILAFLSLAK